MIIRFGMDFDRLLPEEPQSRLGFVIVGPVGFLSILETQLGLESPLVSSATRLVQYSECLRRLDTIRRFYHQSFRVDELIVAKTLLSWRDQWYAAGWDGTMPEDAGKRLRDMAEIEKVACKEVAPSVGERLQAVEKSLDKRKTQIQIVELVDAFEDISHLWRKVISKINFTELNVDVRKPSAEANSDLFNLQKTLYKLNQKEDTKLAQINMKGDGSVIILNAGSKEVSARFVAEYLKTNDQALESAVLTGKNGFIFDESMESVDEARCGFQKSSNWRPVLQVLPLTLGLLWKPLDPLVLLQFLTHPIGPLPKRVRSRLAAIVVESPGIGSKRWQKALNTIIETEKGKFKADAKQVKELLEQINYWLLCPRFNPDRGAPTNTLAERCAKIGRWLGTMGRVTEDLSMQTLYAFAQRQAADITNALDKLAAYGVDRINQQQVERLLSQVSGQGSPITDKHSECSHTLASDIPATFIETHDEIIWLDFSMIDLPKPYPWSQAELSALKNHGVYLQSIDNKLEYLSKTWLRPVMSARKRIVLILHESDEEHHPLWDQIIICAKGWVDMDAEELLNKNKDVEYLSLKSSSLETKSLPPFKRWWHLKDGKLLSKREVESYSSLDDLMKSPYQWVLRYKAKLYPGNLAELPSGNLLKGILIHRLFEEFFNEHRDWRKLSETKIIGWLKKQLPILLEQEGSTLLGSGKVMEREVLNDTAKRALLSFIMHLKSAKIKDVVTEKYEKGRFKGGKLNGFIDMLLIDAKDREIVLDIKWSGLKYRAEDLRNNSHFQLATYAHLRKQNSGKACWPDQAYFIIDNAMLLSQNNKTFPSALVFASSTGETTENLWKRFENTWKWRRKQLDDGKIEVTVTGTESDEYSTPPNNGLSIEEYNDRFNDYRALTGWENDA